jgi:hypothetical protein
MMKFSRAISRVKWFSGEQTNVSKTISVLVLRVLSLRTDMVFETLVFSPLNNLTRLIARENFIIFSRRESNKSHTNNVFL